MLLLDEDPEDWIQRNPGDLLLVRFLELKRVEKIGDSIGQLSNLTHLFISCGDIMCLPNSMVSLPNLQRLQLHYCWELQELPANLGDLNSLTCLSLEGCTSIKSLPQSISKLSNLTSLHLSFCDSLKEFPANSNVVELILFYCSSIQSLPEGLSNLKQLLLTYCESLTELPTDLNILQLLKIEDCCSIQSLAKGLTNLQQLHLPLCSKLSLPNLINFRSVCHLTFHTRCPCRAHLEELPSNLGELSQLLTFNIKHTNIKWLPWSIAKLPKLRFLHLPECFRLETLPKQLDDSIIISVKDTHIRKTWKEFKTEIELFGIPIVGVEAPHSPSTPGYLHYRADPGTWNLSNCLYPLVRILDLDLQHHEFDRDIIQTMGQLPELTHLYVSDGYLHKLPLTLTRLTHLFLDDCGIESCCDSLGKLSTLESLTLLNCSDMPGHLDLPVSLTHFALELRGLDSDFALQCCEFVSFPDSYMASMRKLSNLKTLNLSGYKDLELSQLDVNLTKLRVRDCHIKSLPSCLQHLEIIHSTDSCFDLDGCWDEHELQVWLSQVVDLETLSVTCSKVKVLPSIARHQTLQELQLKDCFNLENLPPNLGEWVELRTLNVSGTRIKSLPDSMTKLQNLRHLILPKCFIRKSLPKSFEDKIEVFFDDMDDIYYKHAGYCNPYYDFYSEDDENTLGHTEGGDEVVSQESTHDSVIEQASSHSLLKPLPDATQVHEGSHLSSRTVPIDNGFSSSHNLEMENLTAVNEDCAVPLSPYNFSNFSETDGPHFPSNIWQAHADPAVLQGSFNGRIDAVGESTSDARCNLQNQEMGSVTSRDRDCAIHVVDDLAAISSSNIHESQQSFHNGEMDIINPENEQSDLIYSVHGESDYYALEDGQDKNPQSVDVKHKKTHKIEVSEESIRQCMSQNMRLEDAAKHLNISRSTMKRRLKELNIDWQENRKRKQHQDATNKKKKHNTKSLSERNSSQPSLMDPTTSAGHDHGAEHIAGTGSCNTFDVKAKYNGDIVRIDNFSLSSSIEQLKEEIGKKHELEVGKFKMKYLDTASEWIKFTAVSELEHALYSSEPSGKSVIRLKIISET